MPRKRKGPPEDDHLVYPKIVQLEDCAITIDRALCCGTWAYWATLPGFHTIEYMGYVGIVNGKHTTRMMSRTINKCCDVQMHGTEARAIGCARAAIAKGLSYDISQDSE